MLGVLPPRPPDDAPPPDDVRLPPDVSVDVVHPSDVPSDGPTSGCSLPTQRPLTLPTDHVMGTTMGVSRIGNVDCTFSATLTTPAGSKGLGLFTGTSMMMWSRLDWFARADGFENAARSALNDLAPRIEKTGLLPKTPE